MMVASSLTMMMRVWDGVTDPFVGFMVDKTNGKFGKNRPFIVIGQIILCVTSWVAFHAVSYTHLDVYKRQAGGGVDVPLACCIVGVKAVLTGTAAGEVLHSHGNTCLLYTS